MVWMPVAHLIVEAITYKNNSISDPVQKFIRKEKGASKWSVSYPKILCSFTLLSRDIMSLHILRNKSFPPLHPRVWRHVLVMGSWFPVGKVTYLLLLEM